MTDLPEFPTSKRATSPVALEMRSMLVGGEVADMAIVLGAVDEELQRRRAPRTALSSERQHVSVASLRAYQHAHDGQLPSRRRYDAWFDAVVDGQPDLVRSGVIRTSFGSWAAALEVAGGQPTPAALAYQRTARGPKATRAGAIALLRACADDLETERLTFAGHYQPWALHEARRQPPRYEVVIVSLPTFHRLFDRSWAKALVAAGLRPLAPQSRTDALPRARKGQQRGPNDAYSDTQLLDAVRQAASTTQDRMTCASYTLWREREITTAQDAGAVRFIPSVRVLLLRFATWRDVLHRAGLLGEEERQRWVHRGGPRYTTSAATDALRAALDEIGEDASPVAYTRWRREALCLYPERRLPSAGTLNRLFGTFRDAVLHARAAQSAVARKETR